MFLFCLFGFCFKNTPKRLADFLLTYRYIPHSVTKQAPSELLMRRILHARLSLGKPKLASVVEEKQHQQIKYHDKKEPIIEWSCHNIKQFKLDQTKSTNKFLKRQKLLKNGME